jgi:hypothetical protein
LQRHDNDGGRGHALREFAAGDHDFFPLSIARLGATAATAVALV